MMTINISHGSNANVTGHKQPSLTNGVTKAHIIAFEAPAGFGKTATISRKIDAMGDGECVLVVLPNHALMAHYRVYHPEWCYVFSGNGLGSVADTAINEIIARTRRIVITQACAEMIARKIGVDKTFDEALLDYNVYFDEVVNSKHNVMITVEKGKEHAHHWLQFIGKSASVDGNIYEAYRPDMIQDILNTNTGNPSFKEMMFHLASGQQVQAIEYADCVRYVSVSDKATYRFLGSCKSFMMAGANVERMSFVVRAKELFGRGLTIQQYLNDKVSYPNTQRCKIIPIAAGAASFKRDADKFTEYCHAALKAIPAGKPFLYAVNKDKDGTCDFTKIADSIFIPAGGVRLPFSAHGLNDFAGYAVHGGKHSVTSLTPEAEKTLLTPEQFEKGFDHCVFLGMARVKSDDRKWMSEEELASVELERGAETCFQALTRTTLRNMNDSTTSHTFVVIDQLSADYCADTWLKGAEVTEPLFNTQTSKPHAKRTAEKGNAFILAVKDLMTSGKKITAPNCLKIMGAGFTLRQVQKMVSSYNKRELEIDGLIYS